MQSETAVQKAPNKKQCSDLFKDRLPSPKFCYQAQLVRKGILSQKFPIHPGGQPNPKWAPVLLAA